MSDLFLLVLALPAVLVAVLVLLSIVLFVYRRRLAPANPTPVLRAGLSFQRPIASTSKAVEMPVAMADKPPMFANFPAVIEGEIAPERLPPS